MIDTLAGLPALDVHAHIATDVTAKQVGRLGHSHTFAVTRTLDEARQVPRGHDTHLTWGIGVHPGVADAHATYDESAFAALLPKFALVGEIGLDRRAGNLDAQKQTLTSVLRVAADQPVLLSIHSTGAADPLLDLLEAQPHPGVILHWWTDDGPALDRAISTGAYFSINAAVKPSILSRLPNDRILTETDFPARQGGGRRPGDTAAIEATLRDAWNLDAGPCRHRVWANLRRLATRAGALDRLPDSLADLLETV